MPKLSIAQAADRARRCTSTENRNEAVDTLVTYIRALQRESTLRGKRIIELNELCDIHHQKAQRLQRDLFYAGLYGMPAADFPAVTAPTQARQLA